MTEQVTNNSTEMKQLAEEAALGQYLARGEHLRLRGVQESDLPRLAAIMAEAPLYGPKPRPWTAQALKKQFEDEKEPGLWSPTKRTYCVVAEDGTVVGCARSEFHYYVYECSFHLAFGLEDRDALGCDLVRTLHQLLVEWDDPARVEFSILEVEADKAAWLRDAGYEHEITLADAYMYGGRPTASQIWGWVSPRTAG